MIPIPDEISFEIGAMLEPFAVGIHGVRISEIGPGKTVVIIGAGPMGLFSLAAAKLEGAEKVILLATRNYQIEAAKNWEQISSSMFTKKMRLIRLWRPLVELART